MRHIAQKRTAVAIDVTFEIPMGYARLLHNFLAALSSRALGPEAPQQLQMTRLSPCSFVASVYANGTFMSEPQNGHGSNTLAFACGFLAVHSWGTSWNGYLPHFGQVGCID